MKLRSKVKRFKEWLSQIEWDVVALYGFILLILVVTVACVVVRCWVINQYYDTPISEVPTWAWVWLDK